MAKNLLLYDKYNKVINTTMDVKGTTGYITIENLIPDTDYPEGEFYVGWEVEGKILPKATVPEFTTLRQMREKLVIVYFSDLTEQQLVDIKGDSAYKVALDNGFNGTQKEWLESLKGEQGEPGRQGDPGRDGVDITEGGSAYEIALAEGFQGTREEWLESLKGEPGEPGKQGEKGDPGEDGFGVDGASAYEIALENGFVGNIQDFLDSLVGEPGRDGQDGNDGLSAYQVAKEYGYKGTEQEWLDSLKGKDGNSTSPQDVIDIIKPDFDDRLDYIKNLVGKVHGTSISNYPKEQGEESDNNRILRAIQDVPINGTLYIPSTEEPVILNNTLTISKNINFICDAKIIYNGTRDKNVLVFEGQSFNKVNIRGIYDTSSYPVYGGGNSYHGWYSEDYVGITFRNMRNVNIHIGEIIGFTIGQRHQASKGLGHWFNITSVEFHINNKVHLELNSDGDNSWMNSNKFLNSAFSYSGTPFVESKEKVYCVKQTLTNGNTYGGNSNTFDNFKFETGVNSPTNWTMIYLLKATGFVFRNYRFEFNSPATFAEIDLNSQDSTKDYVTHSKNNLFFPEFILGLGHELKFTNLKDIKIPRSEVAKVILPTSKQYNIYTYNNFSKNYRYLGNNYHTIKGINRKPIKSTTLTEETTFDYNTNDNLVDSNGLVTLTGSYPAVVYLTNIKEGDEFTITKFSSIGSSSGIFIKCFDSSGNMIPKIDNNTNSIALFGRYITDNNAWGFNNITSDTFTVNSPNVNKIAILISGTFNGLTITSTNTPNAIAKESMVRNNKDVLYAQSVPTSTRDFLYEDIVFNSGSTIGSPYGWKLIDGTWSSIGTIK